MGPGRLRLVHDVFTRLHGGGAVLWAGMFLFIFRGGPTRRCGAWCRLGTHVAPRGVRRRDGDGGPPRCGLVGGPRHRGAGDCHDVHGPARESPRLPRHAWAAGTRRRRCPGWAALSDRLALHGSGRGGGVGGAGLDRPHLHSRCRGHDRAWCASDVGVLRALRRRAGPVATGALRGLGDTRSPMLAHLVFYWLVGMPVTVPIVFSVGAPGIWIGLSAALILIGGTLLGVSAAASRRTRARSCNRYSRESSDRSRGDLRVVVELQRVPADLGRDLDRDAAHRRLVGEREGLTDWGLDGVPAARPWRGRRRALWSGCSPRRGPRAGGW